MNQVCSSEALGQVGEFISHRAPSEERRYTYSAFTASNPGTSLADFTVLVTTQGDEAVRIDLHSPGGNYQCRPGGVILFKASDLDDHGRGYCVTCSDPQATYDSSKTLVAGDEFVIPAVGEGLFDLNASVTGGGTPRSLTVPVTFQDGSNTTPVVINVTRTAISPATVTAHILQPLRVLIQADASIELVEHTSAKVGSRLSKHREA